LYGETRGFHTEKLREEYVKYRREGGGVRSQGWSKWTSGQPVRTGSRRRADATVGRIFTPTTKVNLESGYSFGINVREENANWGVSKGGVEPLQN